MADEKKTGRQLAPGGAADQLKSSVANVAILPKGTRKFTESLKGGEAEKEK